MAVNSRVEMLEARVEQLERLMAKAPGVEPPDPHEERVERIFDIISDGWDDADLVKLIDVTKRGIRKAINEFHNGTDKHQTYGAATVDSIYAAISSRIPISDKNAATLKQCINSVIGRITATDDTQAKTIETLSKQNQSLVLENALLKSRIDAFEVAWTRHWSDKELFTLIDWT